jgi:2-polyprenyl-3-methyl-5-hydroxy-6-metoxy-1,4-benzoquinol methylase
MPVSNPETKPWIADRLIEIQPKTVMDVGAGAGIYSNMIRQLFNKNVEITGVEIWAPYISQFLLKVKYDKLIEADIREMDDFKYDVVILGDVIEHMSESDAVALWKKISKQARYAIIALPTIHMPQGAAYGNPYEVHVEEDWTPERVLKSFSNIVDHKVFEETGAFLAKF